MPGHTEPPQATRQQQQQWSSLPQEYFDALAEMFDATTFRHIDMLGIGAGWRCWEVGSGGGTVPEWLAQRVGCEGHVLATDINVSQLHRADQPRYEIARHDIGSEPPPAEGFDLVHARLVLVHVTEREAALASMVEALRPGGWLLIEEGDSSLQPLLCPDESGPEHQLANKIRNASWTLVGRRIDLAYGRTLPRLLRGAGLTNVAADAFFSLTSAASSPVQRLQRTTVEGARKMLAGTGLVTAEEVEQHLADIAAGKLDMATFPLIAAWGQKIGFTI
jgi:ubiquinone/menaquinone biosynthesis C-methylase UbiE